MDEDLQEKLTAMILRSIKENSAKIAPLSGDNGARRFANIFHKTILGGIGESLSSMLKEGDIEVSKDQLVALSNIALNVAITAVEGSMSLESIKKRMEDTPFADLKSKDDPSKDLAIAGILKDIIKGALSLFTLNEVDSKPEFPELYDCARSCLDDVNNEMKKLSEIWKEKSSGSLVMG